MIIPEDRGCAGSIRKIRPGLGHVPIFRTGAATHHHDRLVRIVFVAGRVVIGGHNIAVGEHLNSRVVIVDAEAGSKAQAPTNVGHGFAVQVREQLVHMVEGR